MKTFQERIAPIGKYVEANVPKQFLDVLRDHIDFLRQSGAVDKAAKAGETAPSFNLKNQNGEEISSEQLLKKRPLVVSFFRGAWCPLCVEEVKMLNESYDELREAGADLVVISPQSLAAAAKQAKDQGLKFNLLVDKDNEIGKAYGVVYTVSEEVKDVYLNAFKLDLAAYNESDVWELPMPARIVIGTNGKILDIKVDPDYWNRPEATETINFLKTTTTAFN
jgi:peroxiredoxin